MLSAEQINQLSADEGETVRHSSVAAQFAGELAVAPRRGLREGNRKEAEQARQGLQESMDLREQGHADD